MDLSAGSATAIVSCGLYRGGIETVLVKAVSLLRMVLGWVLLVLTGLTTTLAAEATYQGKPASFWLDCWSTNTAAADAAFKAMGSNAVPFLIKTLERKPSKLGEFVDKQVADYYLKHLREVPSEVRRCLPSAYRVEDRRELAAFFLGRLGPAAEAAIPALFRVYTDTNVAWRLEGEVGRAPWARKVWSCYRIMSAG